MDRIFRLLIVLSLSLGCVPASTTTVSAPNAKDTTTAEPESVATSDLAATDDDVILIDVRTNEEWETGHVSTALHIPHDVISDRISEVTSDKDAKIVVYCKSGGRAGLAKKTLEELGFTDVENAGGYENIKERFSE